MGGTKRARKQYATPRKPWGRELLAEERNLANVYGFKNKREIRRLKAMLARKRSNAIKLLALPLEQRKKREEELMKSLDRMGLLKEGAVLDDALVLTMQELAERRLQTLVLRKGLAGTIAQARQIITHGHIGINGKRVNKPSYLVRKGEEKAIAYYGKPIRLLEKKKEKKIAAEADENILEEAEEVGKAGSTAEKADGEIVEDEKIRENAEKSAWKNGAIGRGKKAKKEIGEPARLEAGDEGEIAEIEDEREIEGDEQ